MSSVLRTTHRAKISNYTTNTKDVVTRCVIIINLISIVHVQAGCRKFCVSLYVKSQKMSWSRLERLGFSLGLKPKTKGLGLVSVTRKFWKLSVSVLFLT